MMRRIFITLLIILSAWGLGGLWSPPALALTQLDITDLSYTDCPESLQGGASAGSSQQTNCFLITGKVVNDSNRPVYNADVFGRIYDANANPVMQNRNRLGSIDDVPIGTTDFQIQISVPVNQPTPLQLEQFKASGFAGKVRR